MHGDFESFSSCATSHVISCMAVMFMAHLQHLFHSASCTVVMSVWYSYKQLFSFFEDLAMLKIMISLVNVRSNRSVWI